MVSITVAVDVAVVIVLLVTLVQSAKVGGRGRRRGEESFCKDLKGRKYGLCNAFCNAQKCWELYPDRLATTAATGGASTIPPSRFGGNVDDWRIGKGGTMYYK